MVQTESVMGEETPPPESPDEKPDTPEPVLTKVVEMAWLYLNKKKTKEPEDLKVDSEEEDSMRNIIYKGLFVHQFVVNKSNQNVLVLVLT